jgi:hypothetical protein
LGGVTVVKTVTGFLLVVMTIDVFGFHGQPVVPVQVVADVNNGEVYVLYTSVAVAVAPVGWGPFSEAQFLQLVVDELTEVDVLVIAIVKGQYMGGVNSGVDEKVAFSPKVVVYVTVVVFGII